MLRRLSLFAALLAASTAMAQDLPDLCVDRPGLGTPACTLEKGEAVVELGLADWTLDKQGGSRTDTLIAGDTLVRYGVADRLEVHLGWTAFGHVRQRDGGTISRDSGVGDVQVAMRYSLTGDAKVSVAAMPYATLPTGGQAIGAGDWSAGLIVPVNFDLGHDVTLALTPSVNAAVDGDRHGRHLAYGSVIGLGFSLTPRLSASAEIELDRDDDPAGHTSPALAGLSLAWRADAGAQWDAGANLGLNRDTPDVELYVGFARRF